jgi:hypothetical protein
MKDIDQKDAPDVSGGYSPLDEGCFPPLPWPGEFPPTPVGPCPEPQPCPIDPGV